LYSIVVCRRFSHATIPTHVPLLPTHSVSSIPYIHDFSLHHFLSPSFLSSPSLSGLFPKHHKNYIPCTPQTQQCNWILATFGTLEIFSNRERCSSSPARRTT
jgi:hypothetical protein